jgi:UDP-N-acetylglucosamine 2-epimerase (non-hydrolysing)
MLRQVLDAFGVEPDHDLHVMRPGQTLFDITTEVLNGMRPILEAERPDAVLVHGDTSTSFAAALACFYPQVPVGHVEAGLRTNDLYSPWPEEFNRHSVDVISRWCFAPTETCRQNLLREGKPDSAVFVTGNTVIDALKTTVRADYRHPELDWAAGSRLLLVTAHRRENLGEPLEQMFRALRRIVDDHPDVKAICPLHPNPRVRRPAEAILESCERIHVIPPLGVADFHNFLARAYLVLTDSGGIQEEAPALGIPVLVMRRATERPEGVAAGTLRLVGTEEEAIYRACRTLLADPAAYGRMAGATHPYGDGTASAKIADILLQHDRQ